MHIDELPIMSVGINLKDKEDKTHFLLDMYSLYKHLNTQLDKEPMIDLNGYKAIGYKWGIEPKDLYQNLRKIEEYVTEKK